MPLSTSIKSFGLLFFGFLSTALAFAQTEDTNLDITFQSHVRGPFYTQVWFWVIVGLVFIFLLIVLLRGGGHNDKD